MINLIVQVSKYFNLILIALYTYYAFRAFSLSDNDKKNSISRKMRSIIYIFHFTGHLILFLDSKNIKIILLYVVELIVLIAITGIYQWIYHNMSKLIWNNMQFMLVIGLVMLTRLSFDKAVRQFAIAIAALFICIIIPLIIDKLKLLNRFGWFYGILGLAFLISLLFIGVENYGATNWITIYGISIQPSEIVKLIFVFSIASLLSRKTNFRDEVLVTILAATHVLVLVLEKDLGGALIFFITYLIMLYVATTKPIYFFSGLLAGSAASFIAYKLFSHVRVRVMAWQDPWSLIDKEGFQISQSLFAIGTGSWFGLGLTKGLPTNIPVVDSDFIFAAISEELGGLFAFCLVLLCICNFLAFIDISLKMRDKFNKLLALGLSTIYIFQVFLSIGGVIKLIPSTGVTLPFVSYGGSSMLSSIIMISIFQGLYVLNQGRIEMLDKNKGNEKISRKAKKLRKAEEKCERKFRK